MQKEIIAQKLNQIKIQNLQLDINGACNARCWYCPVRYEPRPFTGNMSIDDIGRIFTKITAERGGIVDPSFRLVYTSHYNETLLYPKFEDFLRLLRVFNFTTMILSNGTPLTPDITDLLKEYGEVIAGIHLNIPAIDKDEWKKQTGFVSDRSYEKLRNNLDYLCEALPERVTNKNISVIMNGIDERALYQNGGWIEVGENMNINLRTLGQQHVKFQREYPKLLVMTNPNVVDRGGILEKYGVISLDKAVQKYNIHRELIGCRNGSISFGEDELTGRPFSWLHVAPNGDVFLCCQDYHIDYKFGNILEQSLRTLWLSDDHVDMIHRAFQEICSKCNYAEWKK